MKFFCEFHGDILVDDPAQHVRFMTSARSLWTEADWLEALRQAFVVLHERAAACAGKPRWADKSPENVLYLPDWQRLLGVLHIVRNLLDSLASKETRFPPAFPAGLGARIAFYQRYSRAGLDWGGVNPNRYYRFVYEELVRAPQAVERLMDWLDETFESSQLAFNRFPQHKGLEDPKIADTSEIHSESTGRWRTVLSDVEAQIIWNETHGLWTLIDPEGHHGDNISPFGSWNE